MTHDEARQLPSDAFYAYWSGRIDALLEKRRAELKRGGERDPGVEGGGRLRDR